MGAERMRRRRVWAGVGVVVVAVAVFVVVWFQPQKLVIDERVNEAGADAVTAPFQSKEHATTGGAALVEGAGGGRVLRLVDLDTSNGPDLRVYLSAAPVSAEWKAFDDDYVELGKLKGNKGSQNYEVPAGVDTGRYGRVVIWCKRFSVPFAVADLS